jgi:GNAT superfamily N-acetyltransferase
MPPSHSLHLRTATHDDGPQLLQLWALLFDEDDATRDEPWRRHARTWFAQFVGDPNVARFPVIDVDGQIVATGIGSLELGVPNPYCPRGRTVRLANVITHPQHRRKGYGTLVVDHITEWARSIDADRIDLSATLEGQRIYERAGFVPTTAPRLKLVL